MADGEEYIEIYRCNDQLEANRVVDELLGPGGVEALVHNRSNGALPGAAESGGYYVAVPSDSAAEALQILTEARADGELEADSGELIQR